MLELRPNCEMCDRDLPPDSNAARICTYECTFCSTCVEDHLKNVCPNCGGGFCPRPIRPSTDWKNGNYLGAHPASKKATFKPVDMVEHNALLARIGNTLLALR